MKTVKIEILNHEDSIVICSAALKEFAHKIGFKRREVHKIVLITEEVLRQIIKCSFIDGQESEILIHLEVLQDGIEIKITDHGIPIDEYQLKHCDEKDKNGFAMVNHILQEYMDEVSIKTKGFEGNEIAFKKYHRSKKQPHLNTSNLGNDGESNTKLEDIQIRLLEEHEAAAISRLAYIAYHYSYPFEIIYIPEKIKEKMVSHQIISAGAVLDGDHQIISHSALELSHPNAKTAEIGIAFTDPNYRGYGCINKIWNLLLDEVAVEKQFFGVFAMAVCSHPYSQKACYKKKMYDTALLISHIPVLDFEDIAVKKQQRESAMIMFRVLNQSEKVTYYPPKHHKAMILEISNQLGLEVNLGKHPLFHKESPHNYSNIDWNRDDNFKVANIIIYHIGKDLKDLFESEFYKLKTARYESIYLYLDLADYHTEKYCSYFEKLGFFFAGIMHKENRMNLVLQYLNNQEYDFEGLQINSKFGKKLSKYVESEYCKTK